MQGKDKPVDWDELYPNRFLKAGELKGKKVTLAIADIDTDNLVDSDGKEKIKGFLAFEKTSKQVVLNKTNGLCLKAMFGKKLSEWVGKRVILFPDKWNGEDCIRIWGSPDIKSEISVEIKLPRRKPFHMTMRTSAENVRSTTPTHDPTTGEVSAADEPKAVGQ